MKIPIAALGSPAVAEEYSMPALQTCGTNPIFDTPILLVDLFAGCGGLGEGFATFESRPGQHPFHIIASVEQEPSACRTLRLRSFYRRLAQAGDPGALAGYYAYVRGEQKTPVAPDSDLARSAWQQAEEETLERTLGEPDTGSVLKTLIHRAQTNVGRPLVLIGGPPCQAYSSVGRVRNAGIDGYRPALDHRHFLYRVYLELLSNHRPVAFVMENVKGILSSRIAGRRLFPRILEDLASPAKAYGQDKQRQHPHYRIYSLADGSSFRHGQDPASIPPERFIVQAERYGIPQNRHRVILFGLREDLANQFDRQGGVFPCLCPLTDSNVTVRPVLADLPPLHSGLSWLRSAYLAGDRRETLLALFDRFATMIEDMELRSAFEQAARQVTGSNLPQGGRSVAVRHSESDKNMEAPLAGLAAWYHGLDPPLVLNHETRAHMPEDLGRYLFCAVYAGLKGVSPKAAQFPAAMAPQHRNWASGHFEDRFRVQVADQPATTVMSHIAKDGHYFIHPDPAQCRSLTVREVARLQTFPDSYFFEGNRTQQYTQVGNAVPPFLARQVAAVVWKLLRQLGYGAS
ncbi:MAG TPA: DNA cytosine methyltransferase [Candidatus Contendobacter sp.]|nr:DNA cytosine methyltransferase [Candidatus Contendobacter sp.]